MKDSMPSPAPQIQCCRHRGIVRTCVAVLLALAWLDHAVANSDPPTNPPAYQPADFNGAVGSFRIETQAEPTRLRPGDPLLLVVRVIARGAVTVPPRRLDLSSLPELTRSFYVVDLADRDRYLPEQRIWEFFYQLKPRPLPKPADQIPGLSFVFRKPNLPLADAYQTARSRPIPITILPRAEVPVVSTSQPRPDGLYEFKGDPGILQRDRPASSPPTLLIVLGLVIPPVVCGVWYGIWRHRHPDALRRRRRHQSRACREALQRLAVAGEAGADRQLAVVAITDYLHARFGLSVAEPTPMEAAGHLRQAGVSGVLADKVGEFYRQWNRLTFGQTVVDGWHGMPDRAADLIRAVEEEQHGGTAP